MKEGILIYGTGSWLRKNFLQEHLLLQLTIVEKALIQKIPAAALPFRAFLRLMLLILAKSVQR